MFVFMIVVGVFLWMFGGMDELVKQIVYCFKFMVVVYIEGIQKVIEVGFDVLVVKVFVKFYIEKVVDSGFDSEGWGFNEVVFWEVDIVIFQQDFKEGIIG